MNEIEAKRKELEEDVFNSDGNPEWFSERDLAENQLEGFMTISPKLQWLVRTR